MKPFYSSMIVGKEWAGKRKISNEVLSGCHHPACCSFIAEHLRREVIYWHLKDCPEWMAFSLCSVCCSSAISFTLQWKTLGRRDCYEVYLLMPCLLFSLGLCILFFAHHVWGIFNFSWLNGFNLQHIALSNKTNDADWLDNNIALRLGDFTLQAMLCLLKQQLHNGKDAYPWSALWFIFALMWVLLELSYLATCEKKFQPSLLSPWRKSSTQSHHYKWQLQQ